MREREVATVIKSQMSCTGFGNDFFGYNIKITRNKSKISGANYIKLNNLCTAKEVINKMERQPTEREKVFANHTRSKGLMPRMRKEFLQLNSKANNNTKIDLKTK